MEWEEVEIAPGYTIRIAKLKPSYEFEVAEGQSVGTVLDAQIFDETPATGKKFKVCISVSLQEEDA